MRRQWMTALAAMAACVVNGPQATAEAGKKPAQADATEPGAAKVGSAQARFGMTFAPMDFQPPEVNLEVHGVGVMGGFDNNVDAEGAPGAPKGTIRGFSLWGGVGIKRKKRKTGGTGQPAE